MPMTMPHDVFLRSVALLGKDLPFESARSAARPVRFDAIVPQIL